MTTPTEDAGLLAEIEHALAAFRAAILEYFARHPLDEAHRKLDKDKLHTQVVARIQQTSDVSAQAVGAHAAVQSKQHKDHKDHGDHKDHKAHDAHDVHKPAVVHAAGSPQAPAQHAPAHQTATQHAPAHQVAAPTAPAKGHAGGGLSGPDWADRFPQVHGGVGDLEGAFQTGVEAFVAAMKAAGITVVIKDTMRSHQRAYLMHWSYIIMKGGVAKAASTTAEADADKFQGVDIHWTHTKQGGAFDAEASVKAATELADRFDLDPKLTVAPARNSRHVTGHAVDMTTEWSKASIKILNAKNVSVEINDGPHSGMNPELWEVGKTYGVWHYGTWSSSMSAPSHDRNHWSTDGH